MPDLEAMLQSPLYVGVAAFLGALLGSFANVCIFRIPAKLSIVKPASHCTECKTPIRWFDNLPIVSFLVLRGRCRQCGASYSARYLFVELGAALLVGAVYLHCLSYFLPHEPVEHRLARFAIYTFYVMTLLVITLIDLDHKIIPDKITYPAIPVFLLFGILLGDRPWLDLVIGVVAGYAVVRLISDGFYYLTGREGMGYGDGKLLALIGGLFGWQGVLFSLFGGSVLGTFIAVPVLALSKRGNAAGDDQPLRRVELPFGPFLVGAALVYLFLHEHVHVVARTYWGFGE